MEVVLRIVEGPEQGREFRFQESDNLIMGRKDPTSRAHVNVSPEDLYVSRHHFTIEVRPPNCLIRDHGSANGTHVAARGHEEWRRVDEALVSDGDRIRIGRTILSVSVLGVESPGGETRFDGAESRPAGGVPTLQLGGGPAAARPGDEADLLACVRCGEPILDAVEVEKGDFQTIGFQCKRCRAEGSARAAEHLEESGGARVPCHLCGGDLTEIANADGCAAGLEDVALYLCRSCAGKTNGASHRLIGGYRILRELGRGGMGVVYQGWQPQTGRLAAIKQVLPQVEMDRRALLRFVREGSIQGSLEHPSIVRLFAAGACGGRPFFVFEYLPDGGLNNLVSSAGKAALATAEVCRLIARSLEGLGHMHDAGFVHRDIKPENVLLRRDHEELVPKIADLGLARSFERHGGTLTRTGDFAGTLMYAPLEQLVNFRACRPTADVYAMGVTLYYLLSGRFPLDFPTPREMAQGARITKDPVRMILEDTPRPIRQRRADLPPGLCATVDRAVAKHVNERFQSAREFREALLSSLGA